MEVKYTPGPWIAVGFWVEHPDDNVPDICTCAPHDMYQGHLPRSDREIEANARLIAAAPDMLKALQALDAHGDWAGTDWSVPAAVWRAAIAAIAKATGETA